MLEAVVKKKSRGNDNHFKCCIKIKLFKDRIMSSEFIIRFLVTLEIVVWSEMVGRNDYNWFGNEQEAEMRQ